ncbi:MAG TPA: tetratricopeptide repeat protein [Burkholderiales bacterium]|jgi:tetratricopeptide (TPR) repeat protein
MKSSMLPIAFFVLLILPAAALPADSQPTVRTDPVLEQATKTIAAKDWPQAQALLKDAIARNPNNADYHNLYAYSIRKGVNPDMSLVFQHYNEALRLDPRHRGAHEYIGEAYLQVGNVAKAKEHLSSLDKICFFPCTEFADLKKAISEYEAKPK